MSTDAAGKAAPTRSSKLIFFLGVLTGGAAVFTIAVMVALTLFFFSFVTTQQNHPDVIYPIAAVSWGSDRADNLPFLYQAVVTATLIQNPGEDQGRYKVEARINIASSSYMQDVGVLGTAATMGEVLEKFGSIQWTSTEVTFGSQDTVVKSVSRAELERHR